MINATNKLKAITDFLAIYRPLIDCHMVGFFTNNLWEKHVPLNIREEVKTVTLNEVLLEFWGANDKLCGSHPESSLYTKNIRKFVADARSCYLGSFSDCLSLSELQEFLQQRGCSKYNIVLDQSFMSLKKSHEVEVMSSIVASICKALDCHHVIDIGGGKGYLSSVLFLQYGLKVLGLDSSSSNTHVAAKRTEKMQVRIFW